MKFNQEAAQKYIEKVYWQSYIPSLSQFVAIPNTSRLYDTDWYTNGLLEKAGTHVQKWVEGLGIKGLKTELMKLEGFSPLLFIEVQGDLPDRTIMYYGHFDKQPHMGGWDADKGPTKPVIQNNCLYGRGVGDDGYSAYTSMLAVKAVQQQGIPLPRIVMIMQGDEESGNHIETYFEHLRERLGKVDIVYCFDSDAHNYKALWITKSIRGYVDFQVKIKTLKEGVHSGDASGIVASTYRIASLLLNRLENLQTGKVHSYFEVDMPAERYQQAYNLVKEFGNDFNEQTPRVEGMKFVSENALDLTLNSSWRPQMTVIGLNGLPSVECAGNVMLPELTFKVNMRVPPTFNNKGAQQFIKDLLTKDTPFGCTVEVNNFDVGNGWSCRKYEPWFENVINEASKNKFGEPAMSILQGGSVPIIAILGNEYKESQIVVTGILGPKTNAHGPNEHLDLTYTLNFTVAMADILAGTALHYWSEKV